MTGRKSLTITVDNRQIPICISTILYVKMFRDMAEIHVSGGTV